MPEITTVFCLNICCKDTLTSTNIDVIVGFAFKNAVPLSFGTKRLRQSPLFGKWQKLKYSSLIFLIGLINVMSRSFLSGSFQYHFTGRIKTELRWAQAFIFAFWSKMPWGQMLHASRILHYGGLYSRTMSQNKIVLPKFLLPSITAVRKVTNTKGKQIVETENRENKEEFMATAGDIPQLLAWLPSIQEVQGWIPSTAYACHPSPWKVETEGSEVQGCYKD